MHDTWLVGYGDDPNKRIYLGKLTKEARDWILEFIEQESTGERLEYDYKS